MFVIACVEFLPGIVLSIKQPMKPPTNIALLINTVNIWSISDTPAIKNKIIIKN